MSSGDAAAKAPGPSASAPVAAPRKKSVSGQSDAVELPYRAEVFAFYQKPAVQYSVAFVILFNFCAIVLEKEIDPYPMEVRRYKAIWNTIDDLCNIIFIFELAINLYGSFWRPFLRAGWNYLDTVVVLVGITSLMRLELPSPVDKIKVLRALRILRLFKRVKSLNKILMALVRSIPGVMNAFAVMLIVMCIFGILAVELFRNFGADGDYTTVQTYGASDAVWGQGEGMSWSDGDEYVTVENTTAISAMTARGFHYGQEYFGTFGRSLYTLFQVLTGESWSEAVVRPLLFGSNPSNGFGVALFWTMYILLTQVVLQNVVVAVLLDNFTTSDPEDDEEEEPAAAAGAPATSDVESMPLPAPSGAGLVPGPAAASVPVVDEANVATLKRDFERIVKEQATIKANLSIILSRLNTARADGAGLSA